MTIVGQLLTVRLSQEHKRHKVVQETTASQQLARSQEQTAKRSVGGQSQCCRGAPPRHRSPPGSSGCHADTVTDIWHHIQALHCGI